MKLNIMSNIVIDIKQCKHYLSIPLEKHNACKTQKLARKSRKPDRAS